MHFINKEECYSKNERATTYQEVEDFVCIIDVLEAFGIISDLVNLPQKIQVVMSGVLLLEWVVLFINPKHILFIKRSI
jgi:hypothetical protein